MRIAFCTAHPFLPQLTGGAQRSMQQLAVELFKRGHEIVFLTGLSGNDLIGLKGRVAIKLSGSSLFKTTLDGFDVYRGWKIQNSVDEFVQKFRPDLAVCFSGYPVPIAQAFRHLKIPSVIYFRNVDKSDFGGDPSGAADSFIANSDFTADFIKTQFNIEAITIPPLVDRERYETKPGDMVTFVNPLPIKGRDIVFQLVATMPEIPFLIVEAWKLGEADQEALSSLQQECKNLTVMKPTDDMRSVYSRTRILLAPSQWQEAWGRIATEAHFSAIPVIASDVGGLPEAVGRGGIVIPKDAPLAEWKAALKHLWYDHIHYESVSQSAYAFSKRDAIQPEYIITQLEDEFSALLQKVGVCDR